MFFKRKYNKEEASENLANAYEHNCGCIVARESTLTTFKQVVERAAGAIHSGTLMLLAFPFVLVAAPAIYLSGADKTESYPSKEEIAKSLEFAQALQERASKHSAAS